jgi:hypothetical protein
MILTLTKLNIARVGANLGEIVQLITDYSNRDPVKKVGSYSLEGIDQLITNVSNLDQTKDVESRERV